jgi:hypothetical protein
MDLHCLLEPILRTEKRAGCVCVCVCVCVWYVCVNMLIKHSCQPESDPGTHT